MTIWVLGATGRSGRDIAAELRKTGHAVTLAGRDEERLRAVAADGDELVAGPLDQQLARLRDAAPSVVISTVGPFSRTTSAVLDALPAGAHYVDIGNEPSGFDAAFDRSAALAARGSTAVVGAGNGVIATECVAARLCEERPGPVSLRVDAIPSIELQAGVMGEALAGSILGEAHTGGRRVHGGKLVPYGFAADPLTLTTPDGDTVTAGAAPTGDLLAAWRLSGAADVIAGNAEIPTGTAVRVLFPAVATLMRIGAVRRFAIARMAAMPIKPKERPREHAWGRATATWPDGATRELWLRLPDSHTLTVTGPAEVARRLADGKGKPGAWTPAALFGSALAVDLGGEFVDG